MVVRDDDSSVEGHVGSAFVAGPGQQAQHIGVSVQPMAVAVLLRASANAVLRDLHPEQPVGLRRRERLPHVQPALGGDERVGVQGQHPFPAAAAGTQAVLQSCVPGRVPGEEVALPLLRGPQGSPGRRVEALHQDVRERDASLHERPQRRAQQRLVPESVQNPLLLHALEEGFLADDVADVAQHPLGALQRSQQLLVAQHPVQRHVRRVHGVVEEAGRDLLGRPQQRQGLLPLLRVSALQLRRDVAGGEGGATGGGRVRVRGSGPAAARRRDRRQRKGPPRLGCRQGGGGG